VRLLKATVLAVLVASLIPTLIVGWLSVADTSQLLTQDAEELAKERVKQIRMRVDRILEEPVRALTRVAQLPGFFELPPGEQRAQLYALLRLQPGITTVSVLSTDGGFLMDVRLNAGSGEPSATYRARVRALLDGAAGIRYSEIYFVGPREVPALTALAPSPDIYPEFLAAEVSLDGLSSALAEETAGGQGVAYVVDPRGRMLAGLRSSFQIRRCRRG